MDEHEAPHSICHVVHPLASCQFLFRDLAPFAIIQIKEEKVVETKSHLHRLEVRASAPEHDQIPVVVVYHGVTESC